MTTNEPPPQPARAPRAPARADTVIIGAGLGGLIAAVTAQRDAPASTVVVLDPNPLGGRARCDVRAGFTFNRGPRALYAGGPAQRILHALDIATSGGSPDLAGAAAWYRDEVHRFPGTPIDTARTRLLTARQKVAMSRLLAALWRADTDALGHVTLSAWLDDRDADGVVRALVEALVRVSTYANAPDEIAAGPALANAKLGMNPGVRYLDGGWQRLVDQLARRATTTGVDVVSARATEVQVSDQHVTVALEDGSAVVARSVVVASGGPDAANRLLGPTLGGSTLGGSPLGPPSTAACLELGLRTPPKRRFGLGIDQPLYASVHCPPADLAPEGGAVVHVMRYQPTSDATPADEQKAQLHHFTSTIGIDPAEVVTERFLAKMVVTGGLPTAEAGGLAGRAPVAGDGRPGVFLAGDWVGDTGLLLDAVATSASEAGRLAAARSATMVST